MTGRVCYLLVAYPTSLNSQQSSKPGMRWINLLPHYVVCRLDPLGTLL